MNHILACHDIVKTDFVRGENCYLYDEQGTRYVDCLEERRNQGREV